MAVWLGAVACLGALVVGRAQSLPEGRGRVEFESLCGKCHELERSTRLRLTAEQWTAIVDDMAGRGAEGTSDDLSRVIAYLSANFGPDKPATEASGGREGVTGHD